MLYENTEITKRRTMLKNTLTSIINALQNIVYKPATWNQRMACIQEIAKLLPQVLRLMIFLKNTDGETNVPDPTNGTGLGA